MTSAFVIAGLLALVAFTEYKSAEVRCSDIDISVVPQKDALGATSLNNFIDKENVHDLMTFKGREPLVNRRMELINVGELERLVKRDRFVDEAEVYKTLKGDVRVKVKQRRPIARMLRRDSSFYISNKRVLLPVSNRYTARVPLISEAGNSPYLQGASLENYKDSTLYSFLKLVDQEAFLNKVVSEVILQENGDLIIRPQISRQMINWGKPIDNEQKLAKLKLVYHKIFPSKGWNTYKKINLSYSDQIICE